MPNSFYSLITDSFLGQVQYLAKQQKILQFGSMAEFLKKMKFSSVQGDQGVRKAILKKQAAKNVLRLWMMPDLA